MVSHVVIKGFVWLAMLFIKGFVWLAMLLLKDSHVVIKGFVVWLAMLLLKDLYGLPCCY